MTEKVVIYTDGGADPNPGIGGWAALLRFGEHEKVLTGNHPQTTNNRMELTAAVEALRALKRSCEVDLYTDSQYLRRGITEWIEGWSKNGWQSKAGRDIQNVDLWKLLWPLVQKHTVEWHWVKGHAGNQYNERVDVLARQARLDITPETALDDNVPRLYIRSSCKGNPGPGGWGAVLEIDGETKQYSGTDSSTTNNRMEVMAAIEGILALPAGSSVQVFTTSDYLFQGITKWIHGWRKRGWVKRDGKPVANSDLWQALDQLTDQYSIKWVNAKGQLLQGLDEAATLAVEAVGLV